MQSRKSGNIVEICLWELQFGPGNGMLGHGRRFCTENGMTEKE